MKALLAPGIALVHRLPNQGKLPLPSALFVLSSGCSSLARVSSASSAVGEKES